MPDFKIGAAIALDGDEQFKKQLKEIDRSMSLTRAESKKLSAEFDDVGSSQEALRKKGELLQKQYDDQKKKLDVITEAVKKYTEDKNALASGGDMILLKGVAPKAIDSKAGA